MLLNSYYCVEGESDLLGYSDKITETKQEIKTEHSINYLELWDWNSRFQRIMEALTSFGITSTYAERTQVNTDLINLFQVKKIYFQ